MSDHDPWKIDEQDFPGESAMGTRLEFLLRYAILAPSCHNTQPWKFWIKEQSVEVFADRTRWLKVADPDGQELRMSIGCALENLLVAGEHHGLGHELSYFPDPGFADHIATINFFEGGSPSPYRPSSLFKAIPVRHTSHGKHDDRGISAGHFNLLNSCCTEDGIHLYLTSDKEVKRAVDDLVVRGDIIQFANPEYRREIGQWIGQGVFGNSWLIAKLGELAYRHIDLGQAESRKDSELLTSSPAVGVISSNENDRTSHVMAGQVFQRLALLGASMNIWTQPMSHVIEVPELREALRQLLPDKKVIPQHPFRLGFGEEQQQQHRPRRPLAELLVEASRHKAQG